MAKPRPEKPQKPREPEYAWGDCPGGRPPVLWEHAAIPLWAQVIPDAGAVLLMEKQRRLLRRARTGDVVWQQPGAPPDELAADGRAIAAGAGQEVRLVDTAAGAAAWTQRLGGSVTAVLLDERRAFVTTTQRERGNVFALDRETGRSLWRAPCEEDSLVQVYPDAGMVVVSAPEAERLVAYDVDTGTRRWEFSAEGQPVTAGPLCAGNLWVSAHEAGVLGVDAVLGKVRCVLETGRPVEAAGVAIQDRIVVTDGAAHALDPETGSLVWERELQDEEDGIFALRPAGPLLAAETWKGRVLALDPGDGALRWERKLGQVHGAAAGPEHLYFRLSGTGGDPGWTVAALDRDTGRLQWELRARRLAPDITCVADTLVVELKGAVLALDVA